MNPKERKENRGPAVTDGKERPKPPRRYRRPGPRRHREERSDAATPGAVRRPTTPGLLRFARNGDCGSTKRNLL
jgi:hypothetical protein